MIENIDENMGRLMTKLEEWGLYENTVLIFMSDNGMTAAGAGQGKLGTSKEGQPLHHYNSEMKGHKGSSDEGGVRVPFLMRWDSVLKPGNEVEKIAAHIDILPTLADIAGIDKLPNKDEGRSLVPLLKDLKSLKRPLSIHSESDGRQDQSEQAPMKASRYVINVTDCRNNRRDG